MIPQPEHSNDVPLRQRTASQQTILPLPDDVIAQIKSSTTIVSSNHVVLELLKNALDAKATQVDVTVDFARGGCTVEDDGEGISPLDFREEGSLGKRYCTSKYHLQDASLGRNGTFLASLAAMSLLTITSHHHQHRSTNAITFHHSKTIQRELPASAHNQLHTKHGTRVTVRNLFGNLPVRVKHRSIALDQKTEHDRLWAALKKDVTGLLLGWKGKAFIRVRDGDNKSMFNFNTSKSLTEDTNHHRNTLKLRSARLSSLLSTLTQASYISIDEWPSWVPASAHTSSLSIKGAISLQAAPSKDVQFISLGIQSLQTDFGHNELFDHVNRLFALSDFGSVEDDDLNELETARRQFDKRFKNTGYTDRQLKGRKGVDRHPMFCLKITFKSSLDIHASEDQLLESDANLQTVLEVMSAMIRQWLSIHHFRPKMPRKKRTQPASESTSDSGHAAPSQGELAHDSKSANPFKSDFTTNTYSKTKQPVSTAAYDPSQKVPRRAFAEWSRIKSGKPGFFSNFTSLPKQITTNATPNNGSSDAPSVPSIGTRNLSSFEAETIPRGALSLPMRNEDVFEGEPDSADGNDKNDETTCWVDPISKKTVLLNARTGSVLPNIPPRGTAGFRNPMFSTIQDKSNKSIRLVTRSKTAPSTTRPWLDGVLRTWDNPVFKSSELQIQRAFNQGQDMETGCCHNQENSFGDASVLASSKLSKKGLQNTHVIAQVDKKFILVKMRSSLPLDASDQVPTELLVLIDQHAADERVQVENLWKEFCTPPATNTSQPTYHSKLGHKAQIASSVLEKPVQFSISLQEQQHFVTHAARFAAWGILFDLPKYSVPTNNNRQTANHPTISVTALPPIISSRCTADLKLLITTLRSTLWHFVSHPATPVPTSSSSIDVDTVATYWVRRTANCPPALVDLINSRACRSAIMFNDVLSRDECVVLVKRLADCVFPFMCAHGRPSMVPLGDLGAVGVGGLGLGAGSGKHRSNDGGKESEESFVGAWKKWRNGNNNVE